LSFSGTDSPDAACTTGIGCQVTITTRDADLRTMHAIFTALADHAASPEDSAALIKDTAAHWERQA
jgi:hypothetical protein